jgi:hypothetical protein
VKHGQEEQGSPSEPEARTDEKLGILGALAKVFTVFVI